MSQVRKIPPAPRDFINERSLTCALSWKALAVSILLYRASFIERFLQVWLQTQYKNIVQQNFKLF